MRFSYEMILTVLSSALLFACSPSQPSSSANNQIDSVVTDHGKKVPFDVTNPIQLSSSASVHDARSHFIQFSWSSDSNNSFIDEISIFLLYPEKDSSYNPDDSVREIWYHDITMSSVSKGAGHATFDWNANDPAKVNVSLTKDNKYAEWEGNSKIANTGIIYNFKLDQVLNTSRNF